MLNEPHLYLTERILQPAGEWSPNSHCWSAARVAQGFGYCRYGGSARELKAGDALIIGPHSGVALRASQLGELRLEFFLVIPERLNGLFTVAEWRQLERISTAAAPLVFHYVVSDATAQKFTRLAALQERSSLAVRSAALKLWASCVARILQPTDELVADKKNMGAALRLFVGSMMERDLASSSLSDMAAGLNCSERHFSRLFRAEFGMSFREKQTQLNLQRACQLLLDPDVKIRSVAHDTGYRHVGFFNALFKKRYGVTAKEWREQNLPAPPKDLFKPGETQPAQDDAGAHVVDRNVNTSIMPQNICVGNGSNTSRNNLTQSDLCKGGSAGGACTKPGDLENGGQTHFTGVEGQTGGSAASHLESK